MDGLAATQYAVLCGLSEFEHNRVSLLTEVIGCVDSISIGEWKRRGGMKLRGLQLLCRNDVNCIKYASGQTTYAGYFKPSCFQIYAEAFFALSPTHSPLAFP